MVRVLGIGVGLFILAFIWVVCIFMCVTLSRAQGAIANAGVGTILLAVVITLILWFFPRGPLTDQTDYTVYDYTSIERNALISCCGIMLAVGLVLLVLFHVFDTQRAAPLKKIRG